MRRYAILAAAAFAALASASVWMGGLNQDEGWYLYAARLVGDGFVPYRDFAFTQGPVMPVFYAVFSFAWRGIASARAFTCVLGLGGILAFAALARTLAPERRKVEASLVVLFLLGCNLYHVYFLTIPKTYALSSLFVATGSLLFARAVRRSSHAALSRSMLILSGFALALAAGARASLAAVPAVVFAALVLPSRSRGAFAWAWFGAGCAVGFVCTYGPFLLDAEAFEGLCDAQRYHAMREGGSLLLMAGSASRLVRWHLPTLAVLGVAFLAGPREAADEGGKAFAARTLAVAFCAAALLHLLAPFPYEDYQTPVMGLLAAYAASRAAPGRRTLLLAAGLSLGLSLGSPLWEKWTTNGQDRFWTFVKEKTELAQLKDAAATVERLDPGGDTLLTQDLYLAVETGRRVPQGLEMGPFSVLDDAQWRDLLSSAPCPVAALSGYSFAVDPPECVERPVEDQLSYWGLLRRNYVLAETVEAFGQNATTLMILRRRARPVAEAAEEGGAE